MDALRPFSLLLCGASAAIACRSSESLAIVGPPTNGVATMVLVLHDSQGRSSIDVVAPMADSAWRWSTTVESDQHLEVVALLYACSPDALALPVGSHPVSAGGSGRALPSGARILETSIDRGKQSPWALVSSSTAAGLSWLDALRLDESAPDPCALLKTKELTVASSTTEPVFIAALDASSLLIGEAAGHVYRASIDGTSTLAYVLPGEQALQASFSRSDGEIWFYRPPGCLYHARGAEVPQLASCSAWPMTSPLAWLSGSPTGPLDLFIASGDLHLSHFDGSTWTLLRAVAGPPNGKMGIAWIQPDEAVAAGLLASGVMRTRNGTTTAEPIDLNTLDFAVTVGQTELGTLVGSNAGTVFQYGGGGWQRLGEHSGQAPRLIVPFGHAALIGGDNGFFTVLRRSGAVCPPEQYAPSLVRRVAAFGDGIAAATTLDNGDLAIVLLTPTNGSDACDVPLP
jgi:hypothetical protein